jgi:RND family efflux transporter MFP subunit
MKGRNRPKRRELCHGLYGTRANHETARLNLSFTKLQAPIAGRITHVALAAGSTVEADDTTLGTLISTDPMFVYFAVPQQTLLHLQNLSRTSDFKLIGSPLQVRFSGEAESPREATLSGGAFQVDPATGTANLRATIPNTDGALIPGLYARVSLTTSKPYQALLLPKSAVRSRSGPFFERPHVQVINSRNILEERPVTLGSRTGRWTVVKSGLKSEEWVVITPESNGAGTVVEPKKVKPSPDDESPG